MKETDLAYSAGIIDGEGNIGIYANTGKHGFPAFKMRVRVNNTDEWLIHWLKENFGGSVGMVDRGPKYNRNWKPSWWWTISCRKAMLFLEMIFPYLRLKKPQAELAIKFQKAKSRERGRNRSYSEREIALIEAEKILMMSMNKRGL